MKTCIVGWSFLLLVGASVTGGAWGADVAPASAPTALDLPVTDYSYGYWLNGWRKHPDDPFPDLLCVESGSFALTLNPVALDKPRFALFSDKLSYLDGLSASPHRQAALAPAELLVELETAGKTYRMVSCKAGVSKEPGRLKTVRLWESGRWVQHYDVQALIFKDAMGEALACRGTLDLVAWPGSLTFTAELAPDIVLRDGPGEGVVGTGLCVVDKPLDIPHQTAIDPATFTAECWVKTPETLGPGGGWILCKNNHEQHSGNFGFLLQGGKPGATLNLGGGKANRHAIDSKQRLASDVWHHLALTYDGRTMGFYVNGVSQGTLVIDKPRLPGNGLLRLGKRADNLGAPVQALYDQVRIWNKALTPAQIKAHAQKPQAIPAREGLVFEENFEPKDGRGFVPPAWSDATLRARFKAAGRDWDGQTRVPGAWMMGEKHAVTLNCDIDPSYAVSTDVKVQLTTADGQSFPVSVDPTKNCRVATVKGLKRPWKTGMTDIRQYDQFIISLDNPAREHRTVSLLVDLIGTANITGLCPILCDENGVPTGLPVQLSKNWHYPRIGEYLRAYMRLPATPGVSRYMLRIVYGFYGNVPSASHSQLSLIGYGGNGRWEQLAIGCWGETFCLDMDMSLVDVSITDVRCLMVRKGADGARWNWTDGGWGGDWLGVYDAQNRKLAFTGMKAAYLAHGPCLSEVRYGGHYGPNREVGVQATVHTLRTDDYARTFHRLRYTFAKPIPANNSWLFKMGRTGGLVTPQVAYGNAAGHLIQREVPENAKPPGLFLDTTTLIGDGPWWVAFPGAFHAKGNMPDGSRAVILRSYKATFAGKTYRQPTIRMPVFGAQNVDLLIVPPPEVTQYRPGDSVEFDVEWITLPRTAEDYYGPNEAFRRHLTENPRSWKTVYREAKGNDLKLKVEGGVVLGNYPIFIQAQEPEVAVHITGGVGYVPIRFENLKTASGWALYRSEGGTLTKFDQTLHGNDYWQTDRGPGSGRFNITYNLPVDGQETSTWIFKQEH